jgi:hypothetical protein
MFLSVKRVGSLAAFILSTLALAQAICPVDEVQVKGQVDHPPANARLRAALICGKDVVGESTDITLDGNKFRLSVAFLTQSRKPIVNGSFEKCKRRPTSVIVTLLDSDGTHEYDRAVFDFARDFTMADRTTYALKTDVFLRGPRSQDWPQ